MPQGINTSDRFLAQITALGEVQGVGQLRLLREIFVRYVQAVQRPGGENARGFDFVIGKISTLITQKLTVIAN